MIFHYTTQAEWMPPRKPACICPKISLMMALFIVPTIISFALSQTDSFWIRPT